MTLLKKDLKIVFYWLKEQITKENREWLRKNRFGAWKSNTFEEFPELWKSQYANTLFDLSLRIQSILDAKRNRKETDCSFGDGMSRKYLVQLAQLLNIELINRKLMPRKMRKKPRQMLWDEILQRIEKITMRKEKLQRIWNWLEKQITLQDIEWLKKNRERSWGMVGQKISNDWKKKYASKAHSILFRIQDVLDAKAERKWMFQGGSLSKQQLLELVELLNIKISKGESQEAMLAKISKAVS